MTSIDSTAIPQTLGVEYLHAVIQDGETYTSALRAPKICIVSSLQKDGTVLPDATISGRTITFSLHEKPAGTALPIAGVASGRSILCAVCIKGFK